MKSNEDGAEKESPSRGLVLSDGSLAFVAGSETTSGTLSTIFRCLLQDRATYKRLQAEVDNYYPADEDSLSTKHHQDMPYLDAVMYGGDSCSLCTTCANPRFLVTKR